MGTPVAGQFEIVETDRAPKAIGPYSLGTFARFGDEKLIAISGQLPIDPKTGKIVGGDIKDQTRQALLNVQAVAEGVQSSLEQIMLVEIYYTGQDDFGAINEVYKEFFTGKFPARAAVGVAFLPHSDAKIEIKAWALGGPREM